MTKTYKKWGGESRRQIDTVLKLELKIHGKIIGNCAHRRQRMETSNKRQKKGLGLKGDLITVGKDGHGGCQARHACKILKKKKRGGKGLRGD